MKKIKLITTLTMASIGVMTPIVTMTSCGSKEDKKDQSDAIVITNKNVELNEDTLSNDGKGNYDNYPITNFDFSIAEGKTVKAITKIEITKQRQTAGPYCRLDKTFKYHTGIELDCGSCHDKYVEFDPNSNTGKFFVRFSKGVLADDCQVTFSIKITYTDNHNEEYCQTFDNLIITNQLPIWNGITRDSNIYSPYKFYANNMDKDKDTDQEIPYKINCFGWAAGKSWKTAVIDAENGNIAMPFTEDDKQLIETTSNAAGYASYLSVRSNSTIGIGMYLGHHGYPSDEDKYKFYFVCQPYDPTGADTRDEPIYIIPNKITLVNSPTS